MTDLNKLYNDCLEDILKSNRAMRFPRIESVHLEDNGDTHLVTIDSNSPSFSTPMSRLMVICYNNEDSLEVPLMIVPRDNYTIYKLLEEVIGKIKDRYTIKVAKNKLRIEEEILAEKKQEIKKRWDELQMVNKIDAGLCKIDDKLGKLKNKLFKKKDKTKHKSID